MSTIVFLKQHEGIFRAHDLRTYLTCVNTLKIQEEMDNSSFYQDWWIHVTAQNIFPQIIKQKTDPLAITVS